MVLALDAKQLKEDLKENVIENSVGKYFVFFQNKYTVHCQDFCEKSYFFKKMKGYNLQVKVVSLFVFFLSL